jgi:hypothetical protein
MMRLISAQFFGFSPSAFLANTAVCFFSLFQSRVRACHLEAASCRKNPALFIGYEFWGTYLETTGFSELPDAGFVRRAERVIER